MNYVDIARNIAQGRGIVQSTLGFNQPHFFTSLSPAGAFTSQPPLYSLAIAVVGSLGISFADAALPVRDGVAADRHRCLPGVDRSSQTLARAIRFLRSRV